MCIAATYCAFQVALVEIVLHSWLFISQAANSLPDCALSISDEVSTGFPSPRASQHHGLPPVAEVFAAHFISSFLSDLAWEEIGGAEDKRCKRDFGKTVTYVRVVCSLGLASF